MRVFVEEARYCSLRSAVRPHIMNALTSAKQWQIREKLRRPNKIRAIDLHRDNAAVSQPRCFVVSLLFLLSRTITTYCFHFDLPSLKSKPGRIISDSNSVMSERADTLYLSSATTTRTTVTTRVIGERLAGNKISDSSL